MGEAVECGQPEAERSLEARNPDSSPSTSVSSSPVAAKRPSVFSINKKFRELYIKDREEKAKRKARAAFEDTEMPVPMDTVRGSPPD
jgi:hypothetical protein